MRVTPNSTDVSVPVHLSDSADGSDFTSAVYTDATLQYRRGERGALTSITAATLSAITDAHADGGFKHRTNGEYRVDLPDAAVATGVDAVYVYVTVPGAVQTGGPLQIALNVAPSTTSSIADAVRVEVDSALEDIGLTIAWSGDLTTKASTAATTLTAIKGKTDTIPVDPADASDIAGAFSTVNSTLGSIVNYVDTEILAIKAKTDLIVAPPSNFGTMVIDSSGFVSLTPAYDAAKSAAQVGSEMTLANNAITSAKIADNAITGNKIANGAITSAKFTVAAVTGVATGILEKLDQVWRWYFKKRVYSETNETIKTFADDGTTVLTTQTATKSGSIQTVGVAA